MKDLLKNITLLSQNRIENKRVLLRVDFNVTLTPQQTIVDDIRIVKTIPTIELLLKQKNKVIIISHLGRPKGRDNTLSLRPIATYLKKSFPTHNIILINDFLSETGKKELEEQKDNDIVLLENIRFYEGEEIHDEAFTKQLADLGDVFVNDAFGVLHRSESSIVGIAKLLPSYCGLLLEQEIRAVANIMDNPKKPVVAIIGGAKISTKIVFLSKLIEVTDYLLLGGGLANTFLLAQGKELGKSLAEKSQIEEAKRILAMAKEKGVRIVLPTDSCGLEDDKIEKTYAIDAIPVHFAMLDIGPETEALFGSIIERAKTIIWNGPVGYCEDTRFARGTDFLFSAIAKNTEAFSLIGGGDTIAAVSNKESLSKITHVSTGGGAMLELIENGTLPGIEALRQNNE